MLPMCVYCQEAEDKQEKPGLICDACKAFVHLTCLRRPGTPGDFSCDVFFNFTCVDCSITNEEIFERKKFPWVNVLLLTMHHLTKHSYGISNRGYFHYKTHICSFIDRNWNSLFDKNFKQKKNWVGTIAGVLSVYNGLLVCSGSVELKEGGWWMLMHYFSPAVASHIVQELGRDKPKWRSRNLLQLEPNLFFNKVTEMGYQHLLYKNNEVTTENEPEVEADLEMPMKRIKRSDSDDGSATSSYYENYNYDMRNDEPPEENVMDIQYLQYSDLDHINTENNPIVEPSDTSSTNSYPYNFMSFDSDGSNSNPALDEETDIPKGIKLEKDINTPIPIIRENLFSTALNSVDMPWEEDEQAEPSKLVTLMTEYEEVQLFKKVTDLIPRTKDPNKKCELRRLRAKLNVRRIKRHKHLPMFDIDKCASAYSGQKVVNRIEYCLDRVLDRFQKSYLLDHLSGTIAGTINVNIVLPQTPLHMIRSPFSNVILKPIIRRDRETKPLWVRFQEELISKASGGKMQYEAGYLEYSFIRPHHVAAVNALCALYFWPGIDISESLQYPEYSCVVTYRRLVVGVALLVPPAGPDNRAGGSEGYLSFLCTRAHWQRSGIASFMLYHLLQTCPDKDFTLHVSPTNPAMLLYQKFGFKGEELIQDFYEKYYDWHYKGCTHAVFMRLTR